MAESWNVSAASLQSLREPSTAAFGSEERTWFERSVWFGKLLMASESRAGLVFIDDVVSQVGQLVRNARTSGDLCESFSLRHCVDSLDWRCCPRDVWASLLQHLSVPITPSELSTNSSKVMQLGETILMTGAYDDLALTLLEKGIRMERLRRDSELRDRALTALAVAVSRSGKEESALPLLHSALSTAVSASVCTVCIRSLCAETSVALRGSAVFAVTNSSKPPSTAATGRGQARSPSERRKHERRLTWQLRLIAAHRFLVLGRELLRLRHNADAQRVLACARTLCVRAGMLSSDCVHSTAPEVLLALPPRAWLDRLCVKAAGQRGRGRDHTFLRRGWYAAGALHCEAWACLGQQRYVLARERGEAAAQLERAVFGHERDSTKALLAHIACHTAGPAELLRLSFRQPGAVIRAVNCLAKRGWVWAYNVWRGSHRKLDSILQSVGIPYWAVVWPVRLLLVFAVFASLPRFILWLVTPRAARISVAEQRAQAALPVQQLHRVYPTDQHVVLAHGVQDEFDANAHAVARSVQGGKLLFEPPDVRSLFATAAEGPRVRPRRPAESDIAFRQLTEPGALTDMQLPQRLVAEAEQRDELGLSGIVPVVGQ